MKINHYIFSLFIIICFTSNAQVTHLESYYEGQGGIEGLHYPSRITTDSSGQNLFIAAYHGVTHLATDTAFIDFSFIERMSHYPDNVPGFWNIDDLVLLNKCLYVTGNHHLNVLLWNESSDSLKLIQNFTSDSIPNLGNANLSKLVISPDKRNLYLSTSNPSYILTFKIDTTTGKLSYCNKKNVDDLLWIAASPNNRFLYSASLGYRDTSVCVFERIIETDSLKLIQTLTTNDRLSIPARIAASHDGKSVYVFNNNTAKESLIVYRADEINGKLTFSQKIDINENINSFWFATDMILSPDDRFLYLVGMQDISVFSRDTVTGHLSYLQVIQEGKNGFEGFDNIGAHLCNDTILYCVSKYDDKLFLFNRKPSTGLLTLLKTVANEDGKIRGLSEVIDLAISNDGKNIYTLAYGGLKSIGVYHRLQDGRLLFDHAMEWDSLGPPIGATYGFEMSPDDEYLFINSTNMYGIRILKRDIVSGNLDFYKSYTDSGLGLNSITDIAFSPDRKNFYSATVNQIITYSIDPDSADLTFQSFLSDNESDNFGLSGIKSIVTSNDGKNVYTASNSVFFMDGISVYSRNPADGSLTILETISKDSNGNAINEPSKILLSNDNRFLYTIGQKIHCFERDTSDGHLSFLYDIDIEDLGIPYIYRFFDAAISIDDKSFIGVTRQGKSIFSFHRNIETGKLTLEQHKRYTDISTYSNAGPAIQISSDLKNVYLASQYSKLLASYELNIPVGLNNITQGCTDDVFLSVDNSYDCIWSTGETTNSIKIDSVGEYTVYVTDSLGRKGKDSTYVMFFPKINVDLGPDTTLQLSDSIYLFPVTYNDWSYRYLWNDSSIYYNKLIDCSDYGVGDHIFTVKVTDGNGCLETDSIKITVERISSTNDMTKLDFKLYPNPVRDIITIETIHYGNNTIFSITDLNGKTVITVPIKNLKTELDVSNLPVSIYLGRLTDNEKITVKKITIR
ncbi:beta-propeller fold lactonase family protein [Maribellus maritimus]|uniref:beta-propeller fold lactonase family protein n=1 Tax=Maribellus maritimus TaxID=2870838 RepID=UPI001EEC9FA3|nr:beta-propeller fold lactonase family protein [Maribellus maritimus]MCG6191410.1 beta-propeller fold lactonase family protein [Maribellus maritimus]